MVCPHCNGDRKIKDTIQIKSETFRENYCTVCGLRFYTKEYVVEPEEAEKMFQKLHRERSMKRRMAKKGLNYETEKERRAKSRPEPKLPTRPLL